MKLKAHIAAVGLAGPGLPSWQQSQAVFQASQAWQPEPLEKYAPERLPRNERRRATRLARLAFKAADEAVAGLNPEQLSRMATVFASADGDMDVVDSVSRALTQPERPISPTQFHNSVHNAPAGYWSIATASMRPTSSLSAADDSALAGLQEALLMLTAGEERVLLMCYDVAPAEPLKQLKPKRQDLAVALLLQPQPALAELSLTSGDGAATLVTAPSLEPLLGCNAAAQWLPLLSALAQGESGVFALSGGQQNWAHLRVSDAD